MFFNVSRWTPSGIGIREMKVNYIHLWPYFIKEGELDKALTVDGTHLNSSGYRRWKEAIAHLVNS